MVLLFCTGHVRWREVSSAVSKGAHGVDIGGVTSAPSDSEVLWPWAGDFWERRQCAHSMQERGDSVGVSRNTVGCSEGQFDISFASRNCTVWSVGC
jgi:hypothetical protein